MATGDKHETQQGVPCRLTYCQNEPDDLPHIWLWRLRTWITRWEYAIRKGLAS